MTFRVFSTPISSLSGLSALLLCLAPTVARGADLAPPPRPVVTLGWAPDRLTVTVAGPAGTHVAPEAPARLALDVGEERVTLDSWGATAAAGWTLPPARGVDVNGTLAVSLCSDADGTCTPVEVAISGVVPEQKKKGSLWLDVGTAVHAEASPFQADAEKALADAKARAAAEGKLLLIDFAAVWCPPCNLLAAEVLHAEPRPAELDRYVVATLDVDQPSSFPAKDHYAVGGYPTVVLAAADGTELARSVGYEDSATFRAWIADTAAGHAPVDPAKLDPAAVTPAEAAGAAWTLVRTGRAEAAAPFLARAASEPDNVDFRLARVATAPTSEDAAWLAAHAPGQALAWVPGAATALHAEVAGTAAMRDALNADLRAASGPEVADLLAALADFEPEGERPLLYAAAAAALRSALTGDPERDRGYYTWLAELEAESGDVDGAVAFLDADTARWPKEMTFDLAAARILLEAGRPADALVRAERALPVSWGDNHLRVVAAQCEALVALGRAGEASAAAARALDEAGPPPTLEVRTGRYRKKLESFLSPAP